MPRSTRLLLAVAAGGLAAACQPPAEVPAPPDPAEVALIEEFAEIARSLYDSPESPLSGRKVAALEATLAAPDLPVDQRLHWQRLLARRLLERGEEERAVQVLEETLTQARQTPDEALAPTYRGLGMAYLRVAEIENCVQRHNSECCLFPLEGSARHDLPAAARKAQEAFRLLLAGKPEDLGARWLLNIAAMAVGDYPEQVPEALRLPLEAFASDEPFPRFPNLAPALGVDTFNLSGGVVVEDFDGDGRFDILTSTYDPGGSLTLYRSQGDGRYADASTDARVSLQKGGLDLIAADYDGDGDRDVLVLRGAWLYELGQIRNSLLRNDGGRFRDVTREAGLAFPARPTQTAAWLDFDQDGRLDVYIGNESNLELGGSGDYPCQLFHNRGDGTFVDVAAAAGVTNDRYAKGVAAGDYDNDGDLDLYVSNVGPNRLYRNAGDGTFTDVAPELGVTEPAGRSFACWFFDADNDGWLDLFVAAFAATIDDLAAEALGLPHHAHLPRLYRNEGGRFRDATADYGLARVLLPMGANFGDLDNDGFLDLYLTTGDPEYESLMPNIMLRNVAGRRFADVTLAGGFGHLQKGHGVAFADLDGDGDQDIYHQLGGFYPGDRFRNVLFENPGFGADWLGVELVGTRSNRDAIGARLCVNLVTPEGRRRIHRAVGSVSSFGGSPLRQEIGLGRGARIESLEVRWPGRGEPDVYREVPVNACIRITEGAAQPERVAVPAFRFATGPEQGGARR